jgi:hypothetical protein
MSFSPVFRLLDGIQIRLMKNAVLLEIMRRRYFATKPGGCKRNLVSGE